LSYLQHLQNSVRYLEDDRRKQINSLRQCNWMDENGDPCKNKPSIEIKADDGTFYVCARCAEDLKRKMAKL
jgi:hypothetical protein